MRPASPRRAAARANLVRAAIWYGMISVVLIVVWALSGRDYFWPVWPILGFMLFLGWQIFYVWYGPARFGDDRPRER
jgi:2TM domain